jgi:hypothetical protein
MRLEYGPYGPRLVTDAAQPLLPPVSPAAAAITARWAEMPRPRSEHVDLAARLLALADQVERLGHGSRAGPEAFVAEKLTAAAELRSLAREMGACR